MALEQWISQHGADTILAIKVQPRASTARLIAVEGSELKLAVTEPPADGAANAAVQKLLAKVLQIPKTSIELLFGASSRHKRFLIKTMESSAVSARILQALHKE